MLSWLKTAVSNFLKSPYATLLAILMAGAPLLPHVPIFNPFGWLSGPSIEVPQTVECPVGGHVRVAAKTHGWTSFGTEWKGDGSLWTERLSSHEVIVGASQSGTYDLHVWTSNWFHPSPAKTCKVVVGNSPGPVPNDPLLPTLQTAWQQDGQSVQVGKLASVYQLAATKTVNDPANDTVGKLYTVVHNAAQSLIADALPNVRRAIAVELQAKLPTSPSAAMDQATRRQCGDQFTRMAALLGQLK